MGASNLEAAIDDDILENGLNLSSSSEPIMYTYLKTKYLLRDNPQIDTLFLGFNPGTLSPGCDGALFSSNTGLHFIKQFFPLLTFKDLWYLLKEHPIDITEYILSSTLSTIHSDGHEYIKENFGGFVKSYSRLGEHPDAILSSAEDKEFSINLYYMNKLIEICKSHNVHLHLLYAPMYKDEKYLLDDNKLYDVHETYFSQLPLSDYSDLEIPVKFRRDRYHLNYWGAQMFTKRIKSDFNLK